MPADGVVSEGTPILVTGSTGRVGGTGRYVVAELLRRGLPVRAMVHRFDERSDALSGSGADVVRADFADYGSLQDALDGVEAAYFCYPVGAGLAEAAGMFAAAGRERGLRRVVDLSLDAAFPQSPSPQGRAEWVAEQIFEWAGFGGTHLRVASFFMEILVALYGRQVSARQVIRNSFGDFAPSWIATSDVGAVAATLLMEPDSALQRTTIIGASEHATHAAIAAILSEVTGRAVRYESITAEQWRRELVDHGRAVGIENQTAAAHLTAQSVELRQRNTHLVTDDVQRMTERPAVSLHDFLAAHRDQFVAT